jgi:xylulose-5-phosphate/fructose-6-phosphate phosphoketolase
MKKEPSLITTEPLRSEQLERLHRYWQAANFLSVGQIYLYENALLREPLAARHIKPRLLGHWGTTPGLNFIYTHLNRIIRERDASLIFICGPGHGGPAVVAHAYLEGSYTERFPKVRRDAEGIRRLCRQFSFPGGVPSHAAAEVPGSINEGGELGYALAHAYGAVFDNPGLVAACVVGDGEAETGALATSWHSNKFLDLVHDGAVLPILHLNGYKIANPTVLSRISAGELDALFRGYGYEPHVVAGDNPARMHQLMAATLDRVFDDLRAIQSRARSSGDRTRPRWPMIILRTPKGWTGPKIVDGKPVEGSFRSHQVPLDNPRRNAGHLAALEAWMRSYDPERLFDRKGALRPELASLAPRGRRRMGMNPHANGGELLRDLRLPDFRRYAVEVTEPGGVTGEATRVLGEFLRDVVVRNARRRNFRLFGPDETRSNRLGSVYEATKAVFAGEILPTDEDIAPEGRIMEVLSEHLCQGWLEGYLLTGRHGLFSCYEAFIHIVDSMFNQHAKWLKTCHEIRWRKPIASLNYLLTSHVWRQDHNGFSHQDPGFIDHVANKKASIVRIYLPPDTNTLISVADHCLRSRNYVNVIVAGKQANPQWLDLRAAVKHCTAGLGAWEWAGNDGGRPDLVMACAGDVPTVETLAATQLLREFFPTLRVRVVNVVDILALQPPSFHPHGISDRAFDALFTRDRPVIFAFHGYPTLIHRLTYRRTNHRNIHVHGFKEEGTTTTPFDMLVRNELDRYHLVLNAISRLPQLGRAAARVRRTLEGWLAEHAAFVCEHGEDMPRVRDWTWEAFAARKP